MPVYVALAAETVRVATTTGRLSVEKAEQLLDLLHEAVVSPRQEQR
jgi:hypothetical protein